MSLTMPSNVYYLPVPTSEEPPVEPRGMWSSLRGRVSSAWWRVRLTVAEVRAAFRRASRRARAVDAHFEELADLTEARRCLPAGPARIIDFDAARLRLRPAAQS